MQIIVDQKPGEPDILSGHETKPFILRDLDGCVLLRFPAGRPWTVALLDELIGRLGEYLRNGADAYLGDQWIGSTEC